MHRQENNIKMVCEDVKCIAMAQDTVHWQVSCDQKITGYHNNNRKALGISGSCGEDAFVLGCEAV